MTTLATKFTDLETLLGSDHTEIINALNAVLEALGAPPPGPTTTLVDVVTAITAQTTAQLAQHNALMALLTDISNNTDTIITNNSLNAQRMLQAILSTACACDTTAPLLAPPLDVTPTSLVDEAKCRRVQFYLSIFGALVNNISNYGGAGAAITSSAITELVIAAAATGGLAGGEGGAILGVPGAVVGAIIGIIGAIAIALGSAYLFTLQTEWAQPPLHDELVAALYAADSADAGSAAFNSVITGSSVLDLEFKALIIALWWSGWSNDLYSSVPTVDDSGFDGTICVTEEEWPPSTGCVVLNAQLTHFSDGQVIQCIEWPGGVYTSPDSESHAGHDLTADLAVFGMADISGYWVSSVPDSYCYWEADGTPNFAIISSPTQLPLTAGHYYTILRGDSTFELTLCAEEP